jgi:hypothetical protein
MVLLGRRTGLERRRRDASAATQRGRIFAGLRQGGVLGGCEKDCRAEVRRCIKTAREDPLGWMQCLVYSWVACSSEAWAAESCSEESSEGDSGEPGRVKANLMSRSEMNPKTAKKMRTIMEPLTPSQKLSWFWVGIGTGCEKRFR